METPNNLSLLKANFFADNIDLLLESLGRTLANGVYPIDEIHSLKNIHLGISNEESHSSVRLTAEVVPPMNPLQLIIVQGRLETLAEGNAARLGQCNLESPPEIKSNSV